MNILALDSSTQLASVSVFRAGTEVSVRSSLKQKSHSEFLNKAVYEVLNESNLSLSDIDLFAVGKGPGSFTGIRVAVNIAKTFSYLIKRSIFVANSFEIIFQAYKKLPEYSDAAKLPSLVILNAHKNMLYTCLFSHDGKVIHPPAALTCEEIKEIVTVPTMVLGEGYSAFETDLTDRLGHLIKLPSKEVLFPTSTNLAELASQVAPSGHTLEWNSFTPLYIRASEAEENLIKRK